MEYPHYAATEEQEREVQPDHNIKLRQLKFTDPAHQAVTQTKNKLLNGTALPCLPTISATCSELGTGTHSVMLTLLFLLQRTEFGSPWSMAWEPAMWYPPEP